MLILEPSSHGNDQQTKALKRKICKYEKKWLKYKLDSLWVAFKKVRNSYYEAYLDYCNAVFYGLPDTTINRLQRVQNMCAHLVLRQTKWDSAKACLAKLHWLSIRQRVIFKICVLTFKLLHGQGPDYLKDFLHHKHNNRSLRSTMDQRLLVIPRTKCKTFAARSFSVAAPSLWNGLPKNIRESATLLSFKRDLKTHLYKETFGNLHPQS